MSTEETKARLKELDKQIMELIDEYYWLVAPTNQEKQNAIELMWDDVRAEAECLVDDASTIGKFNLAIEALFLREMEAEEAKENENAEG